MVIADLSFAIILSKKSEKNDGFGGVWDMRLVSWNVNGLRAVAEKGFVESALTMEADVLCVQEIKAMREQLPETVTDISGYQSYFCSAERKGYSGTGLYSKIVPQAVSYGLGVEEFDHEGRVIEADYGDFILYNIYFPNGGQGPERVAFKLAFYDCFLAKIGRQMAAGCEIVVCGDVNTAHREIDLANPAENAKVSGFLPEERAYMDLFADKGLIDTFRLLYPEREAAYSWWSYRTAARKRNVGWRIDYFFVTEGLRSSVKDSGMFSDIEGSDHCPIFLDLDL